MVTLIPDFCPLWPTIVYNIHVYIHTRGGCRTFEREGSNLLGLHARGGGVRPQDPPPPPPDPLLHTRASWRPVLGEVPPPKKKAFLGELLPPQILSSYPVFMQIMINRVLPPDVPDSPPPQKKAQTSRKSCIHTHTCMHACK